MGSSVVICFNVPNRGQAWTLGSEVHNWKRPGWNCQIFDIFLGKILHTSNLPGCGLLSQCRLARGREEWESAALQNANTKCNGLLPVWGPHVPESAFATCLARWVEKVTSWAVLHLGSWTSTLPQRCASFKPCNHRWWQLNLSKPEPFQILPSRAHLLKKCGCLPAFWLHINK